MLTNQWSSSIDRAVKLEAVQSFPCLMVILAPFSPVSVLMTTLCAIRSLPMTVCSTYL